MSEREQCIAKKRGHQGHQLVVVGKQKLRGRTRMSQRERCGSDQERPQGHQLGALVSSSCWEEKAQESPTSKIREASGNSGRCEEARGRKGRARIVEQGRV